MCRFLLLGNLLACFSPTVKGKVLSSGFISHIKRKTFHMVVSKISDLFKLMFI